MGFGSGVLCTLAFPKPQQHLFLVQANAFQKAAVAGQYVPVDIAHVQGWRHAVGQGFDKLKLIIEHALGFEPALYLGAFDFSRYLSTELRIPAIYWLCSLDHEPLPWPAP